MARSASNSCLMNKALWASVNIIGAGHARWGCPLRSPEGEDLVLKDNVFIEKLPAPILQFPREIPVNGAPKDTAQIVKDYGA